MRPFRADAPGLGVRLSTVDQSVRVSVVCVVAWLAFSTPSQAQVYAEELRVTGVWPDAELTGGAGVDLDDAFDDAYTARLRLGALYAFEPWIASLGVSGELGGLARRGLAAELELDHFGGGWLSGAVVHGRGSVWMARATVGFTVGGIEWQHAFAPVSADALLLVVRVPLGKWWFLLAREGHARATDG